LQYSEHGPADGTNAAASKPAIRHLPLASSTIGYITRAGWRKGNGGLWHFSDLSNANDAYSLNGRGLAKLRSSDTAGGNADLAAAKTIDGGIAEIFARYGVK